MRFSIQPEPRQEHYFSPTKKAHFIEEFLHYLNAGLLEVKQGKLHREQYEGKMAGEKEAMEAYRNEVDEYFGESREVKKSVQKRVKMDAINSIIVWQREQSIPLLAEAFGRTIVIPSFFSFTDRKLLNFYRRNTEGITYRVAVPESIV